MIIQFKIFENKIFKPVYNYTTYDMLNHPETKEIMDYNEINRFFLANPKFYKENIYYHVNCNLGCPGVGQGLYLGKDKQALKRLYDIENIGYKTDTYIGEPNWLNLMDYSDYKEFEKIAIEKYNKTKFNNHLKLYCLELQYDGIMYFDPYTTGEEYVLFNTDKVKKIK
jgi:hypothetical protein